MVINIEQYVEPFIDVCVKVFKKLGKIEITAMRPYINNKDSIGEWDVSAVIGFTGEARGAVVISMKKHLTLRMVKELAGIEAEDLNGDVLDVIGEVLNIIAGTAKQRLEEDFSLIISLPSIVRGIEHSIWWPGEHPRIICIPFKVFENEIFNLSVSLESL
ncbi:MAG: chemotaxis protein CheX [Treponema sp.]|jgi:chemotaxis protein CheX|nr:chemotaxis protein CheX [Treponema sp.]